MTDAMLWLSVALIIAAGIVRLWHLGRNTALDEAALQAEQERADRAASALRASLEERRKRDRNEAGIVDTPNHALDFLRKSFPDDDKAN